MGHGKEERRPSIRPKWRTLTGHCAKHYIGALCSTCEPKHGMSATSFTCRACEETGTAALIVFVATIVVGSALGYVGGKLWKKFQLKHLIRASFDPTRILITYSQVRTCARRIPV